MFNFVQVQGRRKWRLWTKQLPPIAAYGMVQLKYAILSVISACYYKSLGITLCRKRLHGYFRGKGILYSSFMIRNLDATDSDIIRPPFLDIWEVDSYIIFKTSRLDKNARY